MPLKSATRMCIAIGAVVKNEAPYILEWLAFHRIVGVDRFCIADNGSDDGTTELLRALASLGLVDHIAFPGRRGRPPQLPAYKRIMRRLRGLADWVAFIDADEFVVPTGEAQSIRPFFGELGTGVGAVALNWAIYGSSGRETPSTGLVIERFTHRAKPELVINLHYKTVLRSKAYLDVGTNPHLFRIRHDHWIAQADGRELVHNERNGEGLSARLVWSPLRINHYVVKSRAEFDRKKAPRGRATIAGGFRDGQFFVRHDRNEVEDPMPPWLVRATRTEVENLKRRLRSVGLSEELVSIEESIISLRPLQAGPGDA